MQLDILHPLVLQPAPGVIAGFTHRNAHIRTSPNIAGLHFNGALPEEKETVHRHYALLAEQEGFEPSRLAWATQVHGNHVLEVTAGGHQGDGDALVTGTPGLVVSVRVADCAAVLLADDRKKSVAAVHAGWRGARAGIVTRAVEVMKQYGTRVEDIRAYVSPCISSARFEVGEEVAAEFPERYVIRQGFPKPHVDLKRYLQDELTGLGLAHNRIEIDGRCTVEDESGLYSFRREGKVSGRMVGFIGLTGA